MKVGLQVDVALYAFFPLVSELAQEIASGVLMEQSQVRIMGANAASGDPEKTIVLINLVPRGEKFDNNTLFLTYEKLWRKKISIKSQFFGNYEVLYVLYPGKNACLIIILIFYFYFLFLRKWMEISLQCVFLWKNNLYLVIL